MNALVFKKFYLVCFSISLLYLIKLLTLNLFYINKGAFDAHKPISYINQPVDLRKTGGTQEFRFKNHIKGKYNIEAKIESSTPVKVTTFNGMYRISVLEGDKMVAQVYASSDAADKSSFKVYRYGDIAGEYYALGEINLDKASLYRLRIENIRGLFLDDRNTFKLIISPIENNIKITKRNFYLKLMISLTISILSFVLMNGIKRTG